MRHKVLWFSWLLSCLALMVKADPDLRQLLRLWRPLESIVWSNEITTECARAMDEYSIALTQRQQWASAMLDATGEATTEYLQGSNYWLGSRPECEKVNEQQAGRNNSLEYPVAKYVVLKLKVNVSEPLIAPQLIDQFTWFRPRHIWLGVCVPGACGEVAQVSALFRQMLESAELEQQFRHVELVSVKALPSEFSVWTLTTTWLLIVLCSVAVVLSIIGTVFDLWQNKNTNENTVSTWKSVILAFSVSSNARVMFDTVGINVKSNFPILHSFKFLSMIWIILGHTCMYLSVYGENPSFRQETEENVLFQALKNGTISVNTFFFITGLLLAYILLNSESGDKNDTFLQATIKFLVTVIQRIIRLIVPYIFTILLVSVTFPYMNATSAFDSELPDVKNCPQAAWRNLLFINNFWPGDLMCVPWGWYLAVDIQLFVLGAALLFIYVNGYPRTAISVGVCIMVASWIGIGGVAYYVFTTYSHVEEFEQLIYLSFSKPNAHVGSVWAGIVVGWMLHRKISFKFTKVGLTIGWILCAIGIFNVVFIDKWRDAFYIPIVAISVALRTTLWGVCMAWILLVCLHKRSNIVRRILELPIFVPLGRATYCAYLLHIPILEWVFLNLDRPQIISRGMTTTITFGFVVLSYMFAVIVSLLFESPVIRLLALLRRKNIKPVEPAVELSEKTNGHTKEEA